MVGCPENLDYKQFFKFYHEIETDINEFTEETLLTFIFISRYWDINEQTHCPACKQSHYFKKVKDRTCFQCPNCSHQIYPLAGTIFHQSTTPLLKWCIASHLISKGTSARKLQSLIGVSNKTALRMKNAITKVTHTF